jgi:MOSC domain-containing protein YiiM
VGTAATEGGTIFQINISRGGVPKLPIAEADVGPRGILGDGHRNLRAHGHPEQALCLYSVERLLMLARAGHHVSPGATGENITTQGLDWRWVTPGARLQLGAGVLIEITGFAEPCRTIAHCFRDGDFSQIDEARHPGLGRAYARVLQGGHLRQDDRIIVLLESTADRVARSQPRTFRWPADFR